MKVLRATQAQFELIDNSIVKNNLLLFAQDGNNDWVVGLQNKNNSIFKAIEVGTDANNDPITVYDVLNELEEIDYVEPIIDEEI